MTDMFTPLNHNEKALLSIANKLSEAPALLIAAGYTAEFAAGAKWLADVLGEAVRSAIREKRL